MMHVMVVAIPLSPPNLQSGNQVLEKRIDGGKIFSEKLYGVSKKKFQIEN